MEVRDSARRHGFGENEIRHAWNHAMSITEYEYDGEERLLVIGATPSGTLLELVARPALAPTQIIHADRLRPKFYEYLR